MNYKFKSEPQSTHLLYFTFVYIFKKEKMNQFKELVLNELEKNHFKMTTIFKNRQ